MSLTIQTDNGSVYLAELGHAKEFLLWMCIDDDANETESETYINKEQAIQIIEHLKAQFEL